MVIYWLLSNISATISHAPRLVSTATTQYAQCRGDKGTSSLEVRYSYAATKEVQTVSSSRNYRAWCGFIRHELSETLVMTLPAILGPSTDAS
jgi:hypothetical protein